MRYEEYDHVFFGGKSKGTGKPRSPGKPMGRRKNPIGTDGEAMLCGICGADDHFRALCPRGGQSSSSGGAGGTGFSAFLAPQLHMPDCPLEGILQEPPPMANVSAPGQVLLARQADVNPWPTNYQLRAQG